MNSLKTKLIVTISLLILILFALSTFLILREKTREMTHDIFLNARSFAQLTANNIVNDYELYIPQKSFVYFNREMSHVFEKFKDLDKIQIVSYGGEVLYDSAEETEKQYEGPTRLINEVNFVNQIQSRNQSVRTLITDRLIYLKDSDEESCGYLCVDENERPILPLANDERVHYLVQPATEKYAVVYYLAYENLTARINESIFRGILLAIFGVGIGIVFAYLFAASITKPLQQLTVSAGMIAKGDFKHRVEIETKDELSTLAKAFNSMAQELEISTKAMIYKERVAKELELAAKIQREFLPREIPKITGIDISAGLLPAEEIGADCYDFIKTDENNILMYLGDVTGHGVPSGIVVSIANALIYNYAWKADLKPLLVEVNRVMKEKTSANMFMTLVLLHWNSLNQKLKYVSAGHEQMIHYSTKDKRIIMTPAGGLALGMLPNIENVLEEKEVVMEEGDALVIYSDGIPEAWKNDNEMYGMARLKRAVSDYGDLPTAFAIRNALMADVKEFTAGWRQMDDITVMVIKRTRGELIQQVNTQSAQLIAQQGNNTFPLLQQKPASLQITQNGPGAMPNQNMPGIG
jgi:serine phosphatase RsbU (regulator of sigma subunit)